VTTHSVSRAVVALLSVVMIHATASAQGRPYGRLSLSIGQGYDDNLFASPSSGNPQSDFITRFGPVLEGGYMSPALALLAQYGFDAERYADQKELNDTLARQEGLVNLRYRVRPRTALALDGSYLDTQSPRELNTATLISAGRARAQRLRGHSGVSYDANAAMKVGVDYEVARDTIEGGLATNTQTGRVGISYRPAQRNTFRSDYRFSYLTFSDRQSMYSVAATGGWSYVITPALTFEVDAGPRLSLGEFRPEVALQLKRKLRRGEVVVGYFTTEDTVLGEIGTVQVRRLTGTLTHTPWRSVSVRVTPAAVRTLRAAAPVSVYEVDGDVTIRVNTKFSIVAVGRFGNQDGSVNGIPDEIPYRAIGVKTVVTLQ
jgi:hypothetical protein